MNTNQKIDNRIKNIDILRGIAILLVVIFHYTSHYSPEYLLRSDNWSLDIAKYGWSGVDIFFVVSGYCIGMTIIKTQNYSEFGRLENQKCKFRVSFSRPNSSFK